MICTSYLSSSEILAPCFNSSVTTDNLPLNAAKLSAVKPYIKQKKTITT